MAYETGAATGVLDLLDKLRLFALANGWTQNDNSVVGNGRRVHLQKGGLYVNLRGYVNDFSDDFNGWYNGGYGGLYAIGINMSDGYNGTQAWCRQPGAPFWDSYPRGAFMASLNSAMPAYHFFAYPDVDDIFAVVEYQTGTFQFLSFGSLTKFSSSAPGGAWFSSCTEQFNDPYYTLDNPDGGSQWELIPFRRGYMGTSRGPCSYLRTNLDSKDGWAQSAAHSNQARGGALCALGQAYYDEGLRYATPSSLGWQTVMLRQTVYIVRGDQSASPYGEIKHMRRLEMSNYLPGDEFTLGSDTWKVFPYRQKGGPTGERALAIRKVS